jgi:hypothetical protein
VLDHPVRQTWQRVRPVCAADLADTVPPAITAFSLALGSAPSMLFAALRPRSRAALRALTAPPRSAEPWPLRDGRTTVPTAEVDTTCAPRYLPPISPMPAGHPLCIAYIRMRSAFRDRRTQIRDRTHPTPKFTSRWLPEVQTSDMELLT